MDDPAESSLGSDASLTSGSALASPLLHCLDECLYTSSVNCFDENE